jgi:hypothetical protein
MLRRLVWLGLALALAASAQKYDGPRPPKPDLPYLKHGENLIAAEAVEAKEDKKKDDTTYTVESAASSVKTPLASPIFLMRAEKIAPNRLQLFRFELKGGHRQLLFQGNKSPQAIRIVVTKLSADGIWKIEVDESLEPGEYILSPEGSHQSFCFQVF